jgi:hypothetical protein
MKLNTTAFCSISRSQDWQEWLQVQAPDLHKGLIETVKAGKGCRANSNKMMDIYFELLQRGMQSKFEEFIKRRFPYIIEEQGTTVAPPTTPPKSKPVAPVLTEKLNYDEMNKHKVFNPYRPNLLSFPQKLIIIEDPNRIHNKVREFIRDKLAVDYIVIEDHAYIEYFDSRYASVIDKVPLNKRELNIYRRRIEQQNADSNSHQPKG